MNKPGAGPITGVILADQIKSLDWRARRIRLASQVLSRVLGEVLAKLAVLLDQDSS